MLDTHKTLNRSVGNKPTQVLLAWCEEIKRMDVEEREAVALKAAGQRWI